jgi:hypothetical protein
MSIIEYRNYDPLDGTKRASMQIENKQTHGTSSIEHVIYDTPNGTTKMASM